jgi:hypothetical protein
MISPGGTDRDGSADGERRAPRDEGETRDLVRALLLEALVAQRAGRGPDAAVRRQTQVMCSCARGVGLPIEHVLVMLKDEWRTTPESRQLRRQDAERLLERVVTLCIDEYYADGSRRPERH